MAEINRVFSPEFRNRLDNIIWFAHLSRSIMLQIVDKFIDQLRNQLNDKRVELVISNEAKAWLADKGYDKTMGARPMARVIQEQLKKPIAQELLFGKLQHGGKVKVGIKAGKVSFAFYSHV